MPNKLSQQGWLDIVSLPERKIDNSTSSKIKQGSESLLATDYCSYYGNVVNSLGWLYNAKVTLYMQGSPVATTTTVGTGYFSFYYECPPFPGAVAIKIELTTPYSEQVKIPNGGVYYMFADEFTRPNDWSYNFGSISFLEIGSTYNAAAECYKELENIGRLTRTSYGYSSIPTCVCEYPYDMDTIGAIGQYVVDENKMRLEENEWSTTSHEYGHHIQYSKGIVFTNYDPNYGWNCGDYTTKETAYYEGWAESYYDWRYSNSSVESYSCVPNTIRLVKTVQAAFWDLNDSNNDGETCDLSMSQLIAAIRGTDRNILAYLSYLKSLNSGVSSKIDSVQALNKLYDQVLLASTGSQSKLPAAAVTSELMQNQPNPFNPSTTISYSVADGNQVTVSLDIYDLRGRTVKQLVSGTRDAGNYFVFWDGTDASGRKVSSGVYFYRLIAGDFTSTRKMVILK